MKELDAKEFAQRMKEGSVIDVREPGELITGKIAGSKNIPLNELEDHELKGPLFFYCSKGIRSRQAAEHYDAAYSLAGGLESWLRADMPIESSLLGDETYHYSRQMLLPEISLEGQERIRQARVLLVGAGGLGSPAAVYLAGAGVGTLGIIDDDTVDRSNLPRQILYRAEQEGRSKAISAKENIEKQNPDVKAIAYRQRLDRDNVEEILEHYDVVLDGADNFPTRYLLNDAAKRVGIPLVSASILGFQGQIATFTPDGPCYRCLWPEPPPREFAPSCSEAGILGTVSGLFGVMQANEALKLIADFGTTLSGSLLLVDLLDNSWHKVRINQDETCPVCLGQAEELPDYQLFCSLAAR